MQRCAMPRAIDGPWDRPGSHRIAMVAVRQYHDVAMIYRRYVMVVLSRCHVCDVMAMALSHNNDDIGDKAFGDCDMELYDYDM